MKSRTLVFLTLLITFIACNKEKVPPPPPSVSTDPNGKPTKSLSSNIKSSITLYSDTVYILERIVYVESGAVLTIQPGTLIKGSFNSTYQTRGSLIVNRGAKIIANGTPEKPIVFTSNKSKGKRAAGDWGGIFICGNAPLNTGENNQVEGVLSSFYGGTNSEDNSGSLKYVRIEFGGGVVFDNIKLNGLTLAGVGSATTVDYVQVSNCGDDAIEFIGGSVKCKHLVSWKNQANDFTARNGYIGKVQYAYVFRDNNIKNAAARVLFSENNLNETPSLPKTSAAFINCTFVGNSLSISNSINTEFKNSSNVGIFNSLILGSNLGVMIQGSGCATAATAGELEMVGCVISGWKKDSITTDASFNVLNWYFTPDFQNQTYSSVSALEISDIFNNDPTLLASSPLNDGAQYISNRLVDIFVDKVNYRGAFDNANWTAGWAEFDPQNKDY